MESKPAQILVVDDEPSMREFLEILLQREGHRVQSLGSAQEALVALEHADFDLVLSDIRMPGMTGTELLAQMHERGIEAPVVLVTAHGSAESAVEAMKLGAYDYLTKPCPVDEIRLVVEKALEKHNLASENSRLRRQLEGQSHEPRMHGRGTRMCEVFDLVDRVAPTRTNILITGESGTGKDLVARAIHARSERRSRAFVAVNCGAIPENLLESELFGHVKGSFTGAVASKMGLFEVADGGTLFLDEIGEMPISLQVKVLRAIQEKNFRRVGGTTDIGVDVRIVAATNRELQEDVKGGRFREDLFYRLNVIELQLPPLRERIEDVPDLVELFVARYAQELRKDVRELSSAALAALERYHYPGNVRELENLIERAVTLAKGTRITLDCLPGMVRSAEAGDAEVEATGFEAGFDLNGRVAAYESTLIQRALDQTGGRKKQAAALLGISFRSLRYRLEKLGLER